MYIEKVEQVGDYRTIIFKPNWFERKVIRKKERIEVFKEYATFHHFPQIRAYIGSNGKLLSVFDKRTKALNDFERTLEF